MFEPRRHPDRAVGRHQPAPLRRGDLHRAPGGIDQLRLAVHVGVEPDALSGSGARPDGRRRRWRDGFPLMAAIGVSAILIGDIPSGQRPITYFRTFEDSTGILTMNSPGPGDRFRQRRPFYRPLFDADLRRRRHRDGAGARHGLFGTAALRHPGLRRLRRRLAADRLARRPLEPPPHDGDLLCRHRRLDDRGRPGADAAAARRGACCRSACSPRSIIRSAPP